MSFEPVTVNIQRKTVTEDAGGGETYVLNNVYTNLTVTVHYPNKDSVDRHERADTRTAVGAGTFTRSDRVVFLEPWDGSVQVQVNDLVKPVPSVSWLPISMGVVAVRPYYDGPIGELQLDVEDVS